MSYCPDPRLSERPACPRCDATLLLDDNDDAFCPDGCGDAARSFDWQDDPEGVEILDAKHVSGILLQLAADEAEAAKTRAS